MDGRKLLLSEGFFRVMKMPWGQIIVVIGRLCGYPQTMDLYTLFTYF